MSVYQTTYDTSRKEWSGRPLPAIYHPNVNAAQVLLDSMSRDLDGIGQINVNNGLKLTNRQLVLNTTRLAQNMAKLGIRSGDVVAVLAPSHHHLPSVMYASIALAAPISVMGKNFSTGECDSKRIDKTIKYSI